MKKFPLHILTGVLASIAVCLSACTKNLDLTPQSQLSDPNFWKTTSDLSQACNYLYTFLPGLNTDDPTGYPTPLQDNYSDKTFGVRSVGFGDGSGVAPATSAEWTNYYKLIRAANNIIEKAGGVTGDAALISRYVGEAKFFRAFGYFELVKRFGDVPFINKTLSTTDPLLYAPKDARQMIVDTSYADLDFAAGACPQPDVLAAAEYGRITRSAALSLKSRIALFEGTWDKSRGLSTANANLQVAIDASNLVMTEGKHSLYTAQGADSYLYEFQYAGGVSGNPIQNVPGPQVNYTYASNKENIVVRLYGQNQSNNISSHSFGRSYLDQGQIAPTRQMIDLYLYNDGLPQGKSPLDSTSAQTSSLTEFRNRDPRLAQSVYNNTLITPSIGGLIPYVAGIQYRFRKYWIVSDWTANVSFVNFNVLRYAEVLLNNIEAKFELAGAVTDAELNATINLLRNRASGNDISRLPLLTNAFVTANNLDMRTEIRRERSVELAFEGFATWDLLRWKTAETAVPQAILGRKYFAAENPAGTTPNLLNGYVVLQAASFRKFNPARDYLWGIPTQELALNTNLGQNPNW